MGAIADAMVEYAQPLIDDTDGSIEQMNKALSLAQICWNLALLPENELEENIAEMQPSIGLNKAEFEDFRRSLILPMIRRHHKMFPKMSKMSNQGTAKGPKVTVTPIESSTTTPKAKKYPGTGRNDPCPCNSGKKYKKCCGR